AHADADRDAGARAGTDADAPARAHVEADRLGGRGAATERKGEHARAQRKSSPTHDVLLRLVGSRAPREQVPARQVLRNPEGASRAARGATRRPRAAARAG